VAETYDVVVEPSDRADSFVAPSIDLTAAAPGDWASKLAERQGFEPWVPSRARRISSAVLSTTQPPLREMRGLLAEGRSSERCP
jgi:hypothetical protein